MHDVNAKLEKRLLITEQKLGKVSQIHQLVTYVVFDLVQVKVEEFGFGK